MPKKYNAANERFGKLVAIREDGKQNGMYKWLCQCDCGSKTSVRIADLRNGHTTSCGCTRPGNVNHPLYHIWRVMISRCTNKNDKSYRYYGKRGIKVCERWFDFDNFCTDMGDRPEGLTIERVDNEKGYSPENCVWASRKDQANNKRNNKNIEYNGETKTLKQWAAHVSMSYATLYYRYTVRKMSIKDALNQPIKGR